MYRNKAKPRLAILPSYHHDFLESFSKKLAKKIHEIGSISPVLGIFNENGVYDKTLYEKRVFSWKNINFNYSKYVESFINETLDIREGSDYIYPSDLGYDFLDCNYWLILKADHRPNNVINARRLFLFSLDSLHKCNNCGYEQTEYVFKSLITDLDLTNETRYL